MLGPLDAPWLLAAALVMLGLSMRRGPFPDGRDIGLVAALTLAAAVARVGFGLWAPLHVNGQGPLWVRGALDPSVLAGSYGPGYHELLGWTACLGGAPDRAVFTANALLSAVSPALLYATARLVGVGPVGALAAGAVLAADPVVVRTAASEGYGSGIVALVLCTQVALGLALRARLRGDARGVALGLLAAGLFAAAAARIHPVAYLPLALSPLVVLSAPRTEPLRAGIVRAGAAAVTIVAVVFLTSGGTILTALRAPMAGHAAGELLQVGPVPILVGLAAVWLLHRWVVPPWLPVLALASLLAMLATRSDFQMHPVQQLSYQRLFWPGLLLGIAPLVPRRLSHPAWAIAAAGAATAAVLAIASTQLVTPTTEQLEYRFLREALGAAPVGCTVAGVSRAEKRLWDIPSYLAPGESAQRAVHEPDDLAAAPGDCLLYVRSSLCSSAEGRALCESIERQTRLERLAARVFPAAPSYAGLPYDRPEVETVVFRVLGHRPGVKDGTAITPAFARSLYARLTGLQEADGCRLARLDTSRFRVTVGLRASSGAEHRVEIAANDDAGDGWATAASPDTQRDCGATLAAMQRLLADLGPPDPAQETEPTG